MNMASNGILAVNTLRLAHDFMAAITIGPDEAIAQLRTTVNGMEEKEVREWLDYLGELLVEEESTPETWYAMFRALASLDAGI